MAFEDTGLKGIQKPFGEVERIMNEAGFVRGGAWDYSKANFDKKLSGEERDYYLRIRVYAVQGRLEDPKATVELENPVFLRHIFPHGLEEESEIPGEFKEEIDRALQQVKENLSK
ncbi:YugN-like protein [Melghirimyces profundicolus]|uniref:YugN-like protein n=1 Tax=Melghirimyces profundicolus TaxID=1242148 RepID=A0A2T6BQJ9_9BACL|nr:YugN family protein [Melghirimyces profundicolus]PTX58316.1 YugN-like protein [Melghirimyces profundicolus]